MEQRFGLGPIGSETAMYRAVFDGNGHTISHLYINLPRKGVGLFGAVGEPGVVRNLALVAANVTGQNDSAALVGYLVGIIETSYATGSVSGRGNVGGLAGLARDSGTVTNSYWDNQTSGQGSSTGQTAAALQGPTEASGIYSSWNANLWDFGSASQYPARSARSARQAGSPPAFAAASATVEVAENTASATDIDGSPSATDPDAGDKLT